MRATLIFGFSQYRANCTDHARAILVLQYQNSSLKSRVHFKVAPAYNTWSLVASKCSGNSDFGVPSLAVTTILTSVANDVFSVEVCSLISMPRSLATMGALISLTSSSRKRPSTPATAAFTIGFVNRLAASPPNSTEILRGTSNRWLRGTVRVACQA